MMNKLNPHPDRPDDTYYWRALGAVSVFLCLPVISVTYVPLVDYPNHLARAFILYNYSEVPIYQATYHRVLEPIPNLAIDLIVPFMLPFIDILVAGKIFLLLTILLFITGCHQLGKAIHGRPTWLVLPCLFFFYNSMLLYGFVNFMVGIGLFCVTVALRLRMRGRWTKSGLLKLTLLSLLACLAHLSAYAFVALTFVVVTAWDYVNGKERFYPAALSLTPLLPPIVSLLVFVTGPETSGCIELNTTSGKLLGMLALILSYNYTLDLLVAAGFLGISIVLVTRIQSLRVNGPVFISGTICVILYLLSPKAMLGGSGIDARYIMPAALLLTLSLKVSAVSRTIKFLLPLLLLLASVRVVFIWRTWVKLDKRIAVHVEHLKQLPSARQSTRYLCCLMTGRTQKLRAPWIMSCITLRSIERLSYRHCLLYKGCSLYCFAPGPVTPHLLNDMLKSGYNSPINGCRSWQTTTTCGPIAWTKGWKNYCAKGLQKSASLTRLLYGASTSRRRHTFNPATPP